ncbi:hypothetical protein Vafri_9523 [Volvox africanus]|uniref:SBP-type domain-containing protein n=1 Tax=Volvox africanus TaxID=51714 RepID=A0A8J4B4I9_9CHLO|nr:hypothetical protein Vafri_9523 [Volvox africanus]
MASEADLELWDIDIDQSSVPGQPEAWTLAGYTWDPVGLVATRKAGLVEPRRGYERDANPSTNPSGDNDSGGSNENLEPGMEVELRDDAPVIDPDALALAPVYLPQPPGCKAIICQVAGCGMCLEGMKGYFLRHRVCEEHSKAPMLIIGDVPSRLCQQCSKFHHVSAFEGSKRTCRVQLDRIRINKRIRRNRKLNAAASAALAAAAGFQDDEDGTILGELPARPAPVFGGGAAGGRAKRPADSSGSGEGSWVHSRKSSRHGGVASGAARGAGSGTRGAGVRNGIGGDMQAATSAAAAAAAAAAAIGAAILNDQEALPESGASDTGSREHPRGSLGVSGCMRWPQLGTQSSAVIPRSPPSAVAPATAVTAALAGMFGGAGSGAVLAQSPASAATSGSGAAGLDAGSMQHSGFSYSQQQQQPAYQPAQRLASLDSLPMSAADVGGPGSMAAVAAAAAAASFVNESNFTAPLRNHSRPVGVDLASLVGQQEAAVAAHMQGLAFAAGSPVEAFSGSGVQAPPGHTAGVSSITAAAACLTAGLPGQDTGGSNRAAPEMTSLLSTTAAVKGEMSEGAAAATAAAAADQQLVPQRQGSFGGEASPGPEAPLSATSLHPLLQQQLHQELILHQQRFQHHQQQHQQHHHQQQQQQQHQQHHHHQQQQQHHHQQQQHQQHHHQILDQQQGSIEQFQAGSIALLQGPTVPSGTGRSLNTLTDSAQQTNARLCRQQQLLILQQKLQQQPGAATWASTPLDIPMQLEGGRELAEAALLAASTAATAGRRPTEVQLTAAARTAMAGTAPLPAQAAAASQLSGPSNVTGGSGMGGSNALRSMSHCGDGSGGGGDATDGGGRVTGASHPSCGTNTLSSSKLVRMSLENDTTLDDSGVLLSNLIDMLQTQAAEPRDGATDPRASWSAGATRIAPSTFSEPGSHGSGNSILAASAAAAAGNGFGAGVVGSLADGVCGADLAAALGDMSSTAALSLSRGGSGCVGSPQNAAMLTAAAAVAAAASGTSRLGSLEAMAVGLPGVVLAGTRGGSALLTAPGLASGAAGSLPVPVPGNLAAAAAACGNRMLDGLGGLSSPGFAAQLQEQVLRAPVHPLAATSDLLLQHQLLLAQQQQQQQQQLQLLQQQQLLRLQQAQAQAQAQAAPSVPAAGLLLSRLLDADTKTHHLSTELNGCLAEKQLLRRQLLVTLSTCQGAAAEQLAAAAMAAGGTSNAAAAAATATATAVPTSHLSPSALGPQLPIQRPLLGGLGVTSAGLGAAPGLVLDGAAPGGLGGFPALAAGAGELVGTAGGLGAVALGASGLRPGAIGINTAGTAGLDMQQMLQMGVGGMGIAAASAPAVALGSTGSGMLGATGRQTAAAQLHALAEARAVAAASAVGPGGGAAPSYTAPDLLTRVSLKIMNCLPDELPSDIRSRMQAFASQAPLDLVQGCLRPGCTEVVLDALHCSDEASVVSELLRSGDADAAAAALLAALPPALHSKDIYLQVADQALCLRPGAAPRHASWAGMGIRRGGLRMDKPVLLAAESMVAHLNDMESCVRVRVYGKHLASPGVTFLARMAGLALEVKIRPVDATPTSATVATTSHATDVTAQTAAPHTQQDVMGATVAPASSAISVFPVRGYASLPSPPPGPAEICTADTKPLGHTGSEELYDAFDVEVQLPYNAPPQGLLILEPRAGVLLGGWAPVLLLEDAAVAADVEGLLRGLEPDQARQLVVSLSMFVDHAERCAAVLEAGEQQDDEYKERELSLGLEGEMEEVQEEETEGGFDGNMVEEEEETEDGAASPADVQSGSPSCCCWEEIFGAAHRRVVRMGHTLLAYSALRACPQLMSYLGAQLMEMGEPLSALPSVSYNGMELLPCAVLSGNAPVINIAVAWAARGGAAVSWRAQVPGQASGVNLLHLAAALPLNLAVHTLDLLWALAKSTPVAADAFACAWFADDGAAAFDAPSLLFRIAVLNAAAITIADAGNLAAIAEASVSGHMVADNLDKMCLLQLASSYIRKHNYTSPLDNVELPSVEVSSAAMSTAAADNEVCGKLPQHCSDDGIQDLDPGAAVAALRSSRTQNMDRTDVKVLPTLNADSAGSGHNTADRSGHGSAGSPPDLYEPLAALAASGCWAATLGASSSSDTVGGPGELYGTQPLMAVPMPTTAPSRMRVSVAPKALAQTAAAAGNQLAAANLHPSEGSHSWLPGSGSGAADASCIPLTYTTNATTTLFPSGSLPAFASGLTMAGMPPYASSLASYYSQMTAAQGVLAGKPPFSMEPLVDMFRPLPESPSLGPENCAAAVAAAADTASGSLPPMLAQPRRGNKYGGGFGDADIDAAAAAAAAVGDRDRLWRRMESVGDAGGPAELSQQHMAEGAAGTIAAATGSKVRLGDNGLIVGAGGGVSSAAAAVTATELGSEKLRGHMRGLARMFKRLFKKGVPGGEGLVE